MKGLKLANPLILSGSNGVNVFPDQLDNRANVTASITLEQDIRTTANVTFNQTSFTSNDAVNVSNSKWLIKKEGSTVKFIPTGSLSITGSLNAADNTIIPSDLNIPGQISAKEIKTSNVSSSILFTSGSTKFGDSLDDSHPFTGSLSILNSLELSGSGNFKMTEIRNEPQPSSPYSTNPVTEFAARNILAPFSANQTYNRKCFAKVATSLTTDSVTFNAVTASAPRSEDTSLFEQLPITSVNDFMFFRNGMLMENDALTITQNGSELLLQLDTPNLGYTLVDDDEIVAWGKFNS